MKAIFLTGIALLICTPALEAQARPAAWVEGRNYVLLNPVQHTHVAPGKVEVLEVFSYGCPACNAFQPMMEKLARSLPANAQMALLPASFSGSRFSAHIGTYQTIRKRGGFVVRDLSFPATAWPCAEQADQ
jgi:thiol-disulfide isomerase/thioredoxin